MKRQSPSKGSTVVVVVRLTAPQKHRGTTLTFSQVSIVVLVLLSICIVAYVVIKNQKGRRKSPKYIPGDNLLRKFKRWRSSSRGEYSDQLQPNASAPSLIPVPRDRSRNGSRVASREPSPHPPTDSMDPERAIAGASVNRATTEAGVDRNTSVRSVMTLPAYSAAVRPSEQILAREGERGGIDVVLEFPEAADDEEMRRDEEMESLYQIRRARRQEAAEREDRRRQRREARQRGDFEALQRLHQESRLRAEAAAAGSANSAALIAEHQAAHQTRERRVSSVQYADLGVARHDGSRLRANSTDSDNRPLLDSAASISGTSLSASQHTRGRSASSVLSVSSMGSDEGPATLRTGTPRLGTSASGPTSPGIDENGYEFISLEPTSRSRAHSHSSSRLSEERDVTDLGIQIPTEQPPQYDDLSAGGWGDAPPYTSPVEARVHRNFSHHRSASGAPMIPNLSLVPSIEVTSVVSPISPTQRNNTSL